MHKILFNQNGHGQVPGGKDLLLIALGVLTAPISVPVMIVIKKIKKKKEKKSE
jgi:hypothetical protein